MAIKVFESAPREDAGEALNPALTPLPFTLPGDAHIYTAHPPKEAIWQQISLAGRANAPISRRIQVLLNYLRGTLKDAEDAERLEDRLLDASDKLDLVDLFPVITHLSTTWTAQSKAARGDALTAEEQTALDNLAEDDAALVLDGEIDADVAGTVEVLVDPAPKATAARKTAARRGRAVTS